MIGRHLQIQARWCGLFCRRARNDIRLGGIPPGAIPVHQMTTSPLSCKTVTAYGLDSVETSKVINVVLPRQILIYTEPCLSSSGPYLSLSLTVDSFVYFTLSHSSSPLANFHSLTSTHFSHIRLCKSPSLSPPLYIYTASFSDAASHWKAFHRSYVLGLISIEA